MKIFETSIQPKLETTFRDCWNHNGILDKWELARKVNPATCTATGHDLDPRYDNLEVYLNSL